MPRLVISTVGTSILTNQIRQRIDPKNWIESLEITANCTHEQINSDYSEVTSIVTELKNRAEKKLNDSNTLEIREASAELNGIYGLYNEQLNQGSNDMHWLITTDTAQGLIAAAIVRDFLQSKGLIVDIFSPKELSTESTEKFTNGIDELLKWMDEIIPGYRESDYRICFNLVGGFKALQGYVNTIAMFYQAHEMIYIFENSSEVIKIPRLPIRIDESVVKPVLFSLMASQVGIWIKLSELQDVPETLLFIDGEEATLSHWGRLIWNNCKRNLLPGELLLFPYLVYEKSFHNDYTKNNVNEQRKIDLQETLAEVSASIIKFNGDTTRFDRRLNFTRYEGGKSNHIDHFYVKNTGWRVSCIAKDNKLHLRHYGEHDYVNDNP
ncbi:putative CRISPR-associated protein [Nostoc sp.]|uniref:putative CRISPR-associated protein n=1 Tax=Nostoc sp. TaxID=1180 RepID=UPI002FF9DA18